MVNLLETRPQEMQKYERCIKQCLKLISCLRVDIPIWCEQEENLNSQITDAKRQYTASEINLTEKTQAYQQALKMKEDTSKKIQQKEGELTELQATKAMLQEQVS